MTTIRRCPPRCGAPPVSQLNWWPSPCVCTFERAAESGGDGGETESASAQAPTAAAHRAQAREARGKER